MKLHLSIIIITYILSCNAFLNSANSESSTAPIRSLPMALKNTKIHSVYLNWQQQDTSRFITVNYITTEPTDEPKIFWDTHSKGGLAQNYDLSQKGQTINIKSTPIYVSSFSLDGLKPNTHYYFVVGDQKSGFSQELHFKTLPSDDSPIEFIQGGDMSVSSHLVSIAKEAITNNTRAILIGGDIAYANGNIKSYKLWLNWFEKMNLIMMSPEGTLIPLITAIGNHESNGKSGAPPQVKAPFYYHFFAQNSLETFALRRLGSYGVLLVLDSGHIHSHKSQIAWLDNKLAEHQQTPIKLALYHTPLYPTHRDENGSFAQLGRQHWLPLFDKHHLTLAFENHDHALKRTKILKNNKVSDRGTVYLGDGCWGVGTRTVNKRWYHEVAESQRHVWKVHLGPDGLSAQAIGKGGEVLDDFDMAL